MVSVIQGLYIRYTDAIHPFRTVTMLSNHPKRTVQVNVRLTVTEREAIIARATKAGKSVSEYIRGAAMHYAQQMAGASMPSQIPVKQSRPEVLGKFLGSSDGRGGA